MKYLLLILLSTQALGSAPKRIASFSLSTDLWVYAVKQQDQLLYLTSKAKRYVKDVSHVTYHNKRVEDLIRFKPDIVVCDDMTAIFTRELLVKSGLTIHFIPSPQSLEDLYKGRAAFCKILGLSEPEPLSLPKTTNPQRVLILLPGRLTCGEGTFLDDVLTHIGHTNCVRDLQKKGWGTLSTEDILRLNPQVIFTSYQEVPARSRARSALSHTLVLSKAKVINIPEPWMLCPQLHVDQLAGLLCTHIQRENPS